jgi:hypothetical protein
MKEASPGLRFRVEQPGQEVEELLVESGRALVGSGAHCEVRLAHSSAAREHADVVLDGHAVRIRALSKEPAITLGSEPLTEADWRPGEALHIGGAVLWVEVVEGAPTRKGAPPLAALALVPFFGLIALLLHLTSGALAQRASLPKPPALFDPSSADCPTKDPTAALSFGQERLRVALAKRERSPFWPKDGVQAVTLFRVAHACLRQAGHEWAEPAAEMADRLRAKLEEDYHARSVRLGHAYNTGNILAMGRELPALLSMLEHRSGPYVDWVVALGRYTEEESKALAQRRRLPGSR